MSDSDLVQNDSTIGLKVALEERYLAYALSTIMNRALPDVRDGLKPVQRRILYAMRQLKLDPEQSPKKSARVVGDVIGRFHPHGEQSIYDALVRLAQDFSQRYPMVNGQGNFGNIDGDNAAAMRYTEARLTEVARLMLDGLDADTVDFRSTYDEEDEEPIVLPGAFPNLLANGTTGIAVGMATSIPPHNVAELAEGAILLIDKPSTSVAELVEVIKGPDFPTGGIIVDDKSQITEAYETGRGGFRVRARWMTEDLGRGQWQVVITEIPYQVQKSKLVERIASLIMERKMPLLGDVRDESAEDIRLILEPKSRTINPTLMMESLFKLTELEQRIPLNLNVLKGGKVPEVMSLKQALVFWLEHQREVLVRRSRHRLAQIERRLEILDGLLIAYLNIDEVIRIIRFEDEPKAELVTRFSLTELQVEAILNMRLRALHKLEEITIRSEHDKLSAEKEALEALLGSDRRQWTKIRKSVSELTKTFGLETLVGKRRTSFQKAPNAAKEDILEAMVEREPITIILSTEGWLRTLKGHVDDLSKLTFKGEDQLQLAVKAQTTDKLILLSSDGKFYTLGADKLPGGRGQGEPVRIMIDMDEEASLVTAFVHQPKRKLILASKSGRGFIVPEADLVANTKKGKQVMTVGADDRVAAAVTLHGDHLAVVGENRKLLIFPLNELPEMKRGRGVKLQRYKDGSLSDLVCLTLSDGLIWRDRSERNWTVTELGEWLGSRAQAGRPPPKGFPRDNRFATRTQVH